MRVQRADRVVVKVHAVAIDHERWYTCRTEYIDDDHTSSAAATTRLACLWSALLTPMALVKVMVPMPSFLKNIIEKRATSIYASVHLRGAARFLWSEHAASTLTVSILQAPLILCDVFADVTLAAPTAGEPVPPVLFLHPKPSMSIDAMGMSAVASFIQALDGSRVGCVPASGLSANEVIPTDAPTPCDDERASLFSVSALVSVKLACELLTQLRANARHVVPLAFDFAEYVIFDVDRAEGASIDEAYALMLNFRQAFTVLVGACRPRLATQGLRETGVVPPWRAKEVSCISSMKAKLTPCTMETAVSVYVQSIGNSAKDRPQLLSALDLHQGVQLHGSHFA
jgi:hypothetical protein